jgi:putative flippase GtrA
LLRNILLYGIIGAVSAGVDVLLFRLLVYTLDYPVLFSNAFTVTIGITISFTLNRKYNFKVTDRVIRRYAMFFCVGMCGLALSELILFIGSQVGIEAFTIKLISVFIVALVQFVLNKTISFKATEPAETVQKASSDD